jgi:uncharacterized membrane protein
MANPEHLEILQTGPDNWNWWRVRNQNVVPDLSGADLTNIEVSGATFVYANLERTHLSNKNFFNMDFRWAILREASLHSTNLSRANLQGADLSHADLILTNFFEANLDEVNLTNAILGWTIFANNDLSTVVGLDTVQHVFTSTVGVDTIYKSEGRIPELFLRGVGAPDTLIAFIPDLTREALHFYKCFISFSEPDDEFSKKLYGDLQKAGVRCWRWKEDARWGEPLMRAIDDAIRIHDKVIIICSETSLNSPPVIRELERALQKEDNLGRRNVGGDVLLPVRLDDYVLNEWQHHRKADVTAKAIGDFRRWQEPDIYQTALERLIRDLAA